MGRRMSRPGTAAVTRQLSGDLALLVATGLLLGYLGVFDWERAPVAVRYAYWIVAVVGGGLLGIAGDELLRHAIPAIGPRVLAASLLTTPLVTLFVSVTQRLMVNRAFEWSHFLQLIWQVWPLLLVVLAVRALMWRRSPARIETRLVVAPPLPEAEAAFRRRLSAMRRQARLIAVEAHDHYLRVHTDAGAELISLRFSDAMNELTQAHGWRVHRSWWVAADAVEAVRWSRGGGEVRLLGGVIAPVSRTYRPVLKEAGWY